MALTTAYNAPVAFGAHIFIGNAAGDPAAAPADWIYIGPVRTLTIEPEVQTHQWFVPSEGVKYRTGFVEWQTSLNFRAAVIYGGTLLWSLLMRNNTEIDPSWDGKTEAVDYVPLRDPNLRRWVQLQYYDHENNPHNVVNLYAHLCIETGPDLGDGGVEYEIMGRQLHSTAQSGQLQVVA